MHEEPLFLAAPSFRGWAAGIFLVDLLNLGEKNSSCCTCFSCILIIIEVGLTVKGWPRSCGYAI